MGTDRASARAGGPSAAGRTLAGAAASRTSSDVAAVVVELGRVVKGFRFHAADPVARAELVDRSFRHVRAELERRGPVELELVEGALRWEGSPVPVPRGAAEHLVRDLERRGLAGLRLGSDLDAPGFSRLVAALAGQPDPDALPEDAPAVPAGDPVPEALEADPRPSGARSASALLWQLVACRDDDAYPPLAERAREAAVAAFVRGDDEAAHEIALAVGAHAVDPRRSDAQRAAAAGALREIARGPRLEALVERACHADPGTSIRASQLLLQLGSEIVPALILDLTQTRDANRRGQLTGILIAMGDTAAPEVVRALESGDERQERFAAQLAGELQHPAAVAPLRRLLSREDPELRREAAKSLAKIAHPSAVDALVASLASRVSGVPALAAFCLGVTASARACAGLCDALRGSVSRGDLALAREIVRALGRLGRPACLPDLVSVLGRRSVFQRRALRELKAGVVETLAKLPGEDAVKALEIAAASREEGVAELARRALARRRPEDGAA